MAPNSDSSTSYVWSHRLRATGMPFAEIFQVLNAHLAEHRAKKDWLGVVSAFLMDDQH